MAESEPYCASMTKNDERANLQDIHSRFLLIAFHIWYVYNT